MHDALGLAGGAGGVEDEEGIFGVHPLGGAVGAGLGHGLVIPDVLRPITVLTLSPTRFTMMTFSTDGQSLTASSALVFWGMALAPRKVPSQVTSTFVVLSWSRSLRASELNPPKTMLWMAPMRVQASMPMASSGIMGR